MCSGSGLSGEEGDGGLGEAPGCNLINSWLSAVSVGRDSLRQCITSPSEGRGEKENSETLDLFYLPPTAIQQSAVPKPFKNETKKWIISIKILKCFIFLTSLNISSLQPSPKYGN